MADIRELNREQSEAAILDAALHEFAEKGYAGATTRSIAGRAGVSNGLIDKYFGTKDNLLISLLRMHELSALCAGHSPEPYDVFCGYIDRVRDLQKNDPEQFRLRLSLTLGTGYPGRVMGEIRDGFENSPLAGAVRNAQTKSLLGGNDPFEAFNLLAGTVYAVINQYASLNMPMPDNDSVLGTLGLGNAKNMSAGTAAGI